MLRSTRRGKVFKTKASCVLPSKWKPELVTADLLNNDDAGYYQSQSGIHRRFRPSKLVLDLNYLVEIDCPAH